MQKNIISVELEPEDVELLATVGWKTGKSANQLTIEAIRTLYKSDLDSDGVAIALLETIHKLQQQTSEVLAAVEKQGREIELFSSSSKQDSQPTYPPPA